MKAFLISRSRFMLNNSSLKFQGGCFHSLQFAIGINCSSPPFMSHIKFNSNYSSSKKTVAFFPIKPGMLHVGNYFGALQKCVQLQDEGTKVFLCITDVHALENFENEMNLKKSIMLTVATVLAVGIDPSKSVIFQQSKIPAHSQLDWILQCLVNEKEPKKLPCHALKLSRCKDITLGQYVSPVLSCANALLYRANIMPIGSDTLNMVQMIQNIGQNFNEKHGECFTLPEACVDEGYSSCIRSLRQPVEKMSRSNSDALSRINLLDDAETVTAKLKKAVTDCTSAVYFDYINRPGVSNLMVLHNLVSGKGWDTIEMENRALESAQYKFIVADSLNLFLSPIRDRAETYLADENNLCSVLKSGMSEANTVAQETLNDVYETIGFSDNKNNSVTPIPTNFNLSFKVLPGNSPLKYKNCKHIFSGIQPTGVLHLGNYFGAVKQWVSLQNAGHDVVLSIVDQHAITVSQKRCDLLHNTLTMAASLIACGIDPEKSILFQQSHVPEHSELNMLLRSVAHTALLARQAHYKDKLKTLKHVPSLGLFSYPVLQAADILLYETTHVPVGDDQKQHIQLARQIARQFNAKYGKDILRLPQAIILDDSLARVKSLCQPNKKMSKSDVNPNSRIEILDSPDLIRHKVNSAYTAEYYGNIACTPEDSQAAVANLMSIHSVVSGIDLESLNKKYANESIDEYKNIVGNAVAEHMAPIKEKADLLLKEPEGLLQILEWGAKKAQIRAQNTIGKIHQKLGFSLW